MTDNTMTPEQLEALKLRVAEQAQKHGGIYDPDRQVPVRLEDLLAVINAAQGSLYWQGVASANVQGQVFEMLAALLIDAGVDHVDLSAGYVATIEKPVGDGEKKWRSIRVLHRPPESARRFAFDLQRAVEKIKESKPA